MAVINIYQAPSPSDLLPPPGGLQMATQLTNLVIDPAPSIGGPSTVNKISSGTVGPVPVISFTVYMVKYNDFVNDYYGRVHIVPSYINVGNLVSNQTYSVEVFNAYLDTTKTLSSILSSNAAGINYSGATPPSTYYPLQSNFYSFQITTAGPPQINAQFTFNFVGTLDDRVLTFSGSRTVGLPYQFRDGVTEVLEFLTEIMESRDGTEQRTRLRKKPKNSLAVEYFVPYYDMQRAENIIYGWVANTWSVSNWCEAIFYGLVSSGTTILTLDTTTVDLRVGGLITLWSTPSNNVTVEISSLTSTTVVLALPIASNLPNCWVMPARLGRATENMRRHTNAHDATIVANYQIIDTTEIQSSASAVQYQGIDVFLDDNYTDSGRLIDFYLQKVDVIEFEGTSFDHKTPWLNPKPIRDFKFITRNLSELWTLRKWLYRRSGRWRPFWAPTRETNLRIAQAGTITNSLTIKSDEYSNYASARDHIAIQKTDGTWVLCGIISASNSGATTNLTLDTNIGLSTTLVDRICFLGLKRLHADRIEINYYSGGVATCTVPVAEISP